MIRLASAVIVATLLVACSGTPEPTPPAVVLLAGSVATGAAQSLPPPADTLGPGDVARVQVNGLAVRRYPTTSAPLVAAYTANGPEPQLVKAMVRVDDGHFLGIVAGPLMIQGLPWYRVANHSRQAGEAMDHPGVWWDADGDEVHADFGWVAGGDGSSAYLVPGEPPPHEAVHGPGPPPFAVIAGVGDAKSDRFELSSRAVLDWVAADPEFGDCDVTVTLQPAGARMAASHVSGWAKGTAQWPEEQPTASLGEHWLEISSDCSWSIEAYPGQY